MIQLATVRTLLEYVDWSNRRLLECAGPVSDLDLDRDMQVGPGTLRRVLLHTYVGEHVWLKRWQGALETKWLDESEKVSIAELSKRFEAHIRERDAYLARLFEHDLHQVRPYRDSKGTLYHAPLGEMLMQGVMHSKHHQAQACNVLKRLGAQWPELDYMMRIRRVG